MFLETVYLNSMNSKCTGSSDETGMYHFTENKSYLSYPDRRYEVEKKFGLKPAGRSYITSTGPGRPIPKGCYDTIDGFYDPRKHCVYDVYIPDKIIRIPTKTEHKWIIAHCRTA